MSASQTKSITARLRALMAEATPGPWLCDDRLARDGDTKVRQLNGCGVAYCCDETASEEGVTHAKRDAALIAESRNVLAELLTVVEGVANAPGQDDGAWHQPCGLCGMKVYNPNVQHAPDCAWVVARKLTGGAT